MQTKPTATGWVGAGQDGAQQKKLTKGRGAGGGADRHLEGPHKAGPKTLLCGAMAIQHKKHQQNGRTSAAKSWVANS